MLTKYAEVSQAERAVEVLDAFVVPANVGPKRLARLRRKAHRHNFEYSPRPGYIYVRSRAISSRCNDNFDEFPAAEIKQAYATFVGKPVFVNHHNADHRRARGVIIDAALHEDTNPDGTEDTWAEVLMEVDAVSFPVLAREVIAGNIARTSMGTDVEYSECTACGNKAVTPADYCQHIPKMKGMKIRRAAYSPDGKVAGTEEVLIAERCYGLRFFENSLLVEDPADPTAFVLGVDGEGISRSAAKAVIDEAEAVVRKAAASAPASVGRTAARTEAGAIDDVARFLRGGDDPTKHCSECGSTFGWSSALHRFICPEGHSTVPAMAAHHTAAPDYLTTVDGLKVGDLLFYRNSYAGHSIDVMVAKVNPGEIIIAGDRRTGFTKQIDDEDLRAGRAKIHHREDRNMDDSRRAVAALTTTAYGETKAPAKVDTLRAENCPVCGDDEAYNGDKCSVCGYMQPPDQFGDPDLNKARETDLRQEQQQGLDPQAVEEAGDGQPLECDQCGEVFDGAEGDAEAGADEALDPNDPLVAENAEDPEGEEADETDPSDLSDLEDVDDDETFAEEDPEAAPEADEKNPFAKDNDEDTDADKNGLDIEKPQVSPGAEEDTEADTEVDPTKATDPAAEEKAEPVDETDDPFVDDDLKDLDPEDEDDLPVDPAVGEARITAEPEQSTETTLDAPVQANQTCPVCGQGTLVPRATTIATDGTEPKINEVGTDPTKVKEKVTAMNQPNPAQKNRSKIIAAIVEQQKTIEGLNERLAMSESNNRLLRDAVATIAVAAGLGKHAKFAGIVRAAGLKVADAEKNDGDSIGGTPATTTEQAKTPDATDNVESEGAAPAAANTGVTPEGVTDVNNSDVVANPAVLDNLQSATAPVSGTDAIDPAGASSETGTSVTVGTPSSEPFDKPEDSGWKSAAQEQERFIASLRLARLRIAAGLAQGEDLSIAQTISASKTPLGEITAQVEALSSVASKQATPAPRHLVPRAAQRAGGVQPTRQPSMQATAGAEASSEGSEWMFGGDDLG